MSMLVELDELLEGARAAPFRLMSVLDELDDGRVDEAAPAPFRLMSVELDELEPGMLPEIDPFTPEWMSVVEDELAPGTTATPGATSVVVTLPPCASGTLGMQPEGCVLAASMHFGCPEGRVTEYVSARATPKAASIEAARRLIVKLLRFISFPPFLN